MLQALLIFFVSCTASAQEFVYRLADGETISFYTRVAPDLSGIGFSKTKIGDFKYAPVFLDFATFKESALIQTAYDPTFSPDYNLEKKQGFLFGARGGSTSYAKYFSFYLPGKFTRAHREVFFANISGYATVALLSDETLLPAVLKPFVGKYIIMGKRWRWFIVDALKDSQGDVVDVQVIYPLNSDKAAPPLCPNLSSNFDQADSMISPRGQYISLKRTNSAKVPVIVRTKDCAVMSSPALAQLYGGKATFSNDERFMAFHAFGVNGEVFTEDSITNDGMIKEWADKKVVANAFLYDIANDQVVRLTSNSETNPGVNFFPNFSGDGQWIYFHRHAPGEKATEIWRIENPLMNSP